jgi:ABC-type multidrug transport system fused ATPase/permease subunit
MQKRVFAKMLRNDVAYFVGGHASDLMAKIRLYGTAAGTAFVTMTNRLLTETLTMLALFGVMLYQDAWMTMFCMLILPLILGLVSFLSRKIRAVASEEVALSGAYFSIGSEAFAGIKTVKSYGLEQKSIDRFDASVDRLENRIFSIARISAATVPIMEFLGGLVIGAFVVYAAWQTITHGKTPGEFTAFITAFLMAYQPAEKVSKYWVELQRSLVQIGNMYEILDAPAALIADGTIGKSDLGTGLTLSNVGFSYDGAKPALADISLDIAGGEILGVVGRSGAGKSTLIDLVMRFYDPTEGHIAFGGHDLCQIKRADLKDTVALISQDVFLFDGTIRDNIRDGHPGASDAEIADAAERAALDVALLDLPNGLDTIVGSNGANLSGGQKQRVGIARAMIKDAKLYIFDEATSALDVENERRIMKNLVKHTSDATVLFITHRPATLEYVDRVLFLDQGKVAGLGKYDALLKDNSAFQALFLG